MTIRWTAAAVAAFALVSVPVAFAQEKTGDHKMGTKMQGKMHGKMHMMKGPIYACKGCKMAVSPEMAKSMGYKDKMGHKLVKMDKLPAGMKMMGGKRMHDKMMKHEGKMGGKMMEKP